MDIDLKFMCNSRTLAHALQSIRKRPHNSDDARPQCIDTVHISSMWCEIGMCMCVREREMDRLSFIRKWTNKFTICHRAITIKTIIIITRIRVICNIHRQAYEIVRSMLSKNHDILQVGVFLCMCGFSLLEVSRTLLEVYFFLFVHYYSLAKSVHNLQCQKCFKFSFFFDCIELRLMKERERKKKMVSHEIDFIFMVLVNEWNGT